MFSRAVGFGLLLLSFAALSACRPPNPEYPVSSVPHATSLQQVQQADGVMLIDFYADWCPPCRVQGPVVAEVRARVGDQAQVLKVDVDRQRELAEAFGIEAMPTLVVLKDGQEVERLKGLQRSPEKLIKLLQKHASEQA